MPGDHNDAVLLAGNLADDVHHRKLANHRVGREHIAIDFDSRPAQLARDVVFGFLVAVAAQWTLSDSDKLLHVLEGALGVNLRRRRRTGGRIELCR